MISQQQHQYGRLITKNLGRLQHHNQVIDLHWPFSLWASNLTSSSNFATTVFKRRAPTFAVTAKEGQIEPMLYDDRTILSYGKPSTLMILSHTLYAYQYSADKQLQRFHLQHRL